ncbi:MAG: pyridoxal phosphate-dependent aminotransferase [Candidatus Dadabacteria bacterium]|nr:pyridoxal phosphate-dependent aminotransferase [Candidatus Dadabacteria bacterium]
MPPDANIIKASRLAEGVAPFYVMEVLERATRMESGGADIVHLEVGHPDLPTAPEVCEAAMDSIRRGETGYSPSPGIEPLREAVAESANSRYGLSLTADNILITSGSSPALLLAMMCVVNPGDEVVITSPCYACYPGVIRAAGGVPVEVPVYAGEDYRIDIGRVKRALNPKTAAIIINSPSNPTGAVLDDDALEAVCSLGLPVVSDEIYHGLEYGVKSRSALNHTERAIVVNGFSKLCSMTGWRLGYMAAPREVILAARKLQQNLFISPNMFVQHGGIAAVKSVVPRAGEIAAAFSERRDAMERELRRIGLPPCGRPRGAFYMFVKPPGGAGRDSRALAFDILEKTGVAVTPGVDFGSEGEGHLRLSYANSVANIEKGVRRLGSYLAGSG